MCRLAGGDDCTKQTVAAGVTSIPVFAEVVSTWNTCMSILPVDGDRGSHKRARLQTGSSRQSS